ncbi:unnamed protein product [Phaedon cochleariae]|uniref:MADF domain-containing protein n=1 Tax=Phaedon cochleariae TaxID=80249 RepID=A0A9N9SJM0_PHACE|nr:unnamed protein product [Phaedon cochleariae]
MRENAWKTISAILEDTTPEECEHRWKILRNKYTGLRREEKCRPSGSGASEITWPYYKSMSFLDPYLQTRKSFSNLSVKKNPEVRQWDSLNTIMGEDREEDTQTENILPSID